MPTHTIEVTDISDNLIQLLDKRVDQQQAPSRAAYIRDLLRQDLTGATRQTTIAEILDPIHESVRQSGMTNEEVNALLTETLADVQGERRQR